MVRRFKYTREDFGALPVKLEHLTLYLNFIGDCVEASNCLEMTAAKSINELQLDAKNLEILSVEWCRSPHDDQASPLLYEYLRDKDKLLVKLPLLLEAGERFFVRTRTRAFPSDHVLEGIYKDATPPGAPQQYMSQCQQWGFQRIMPIFDDCRSKCTMTTSIEADNTYTHLISNGNISRTLNPDSRPVLKAGDTSRQIITYENSIPMAPYLFLVCAGTWDVLADEVTYPSGRSVRLEYLVPPGSGDDARIPMSILKRAILWIQKTQDYEYTSDTYRTICMTKSNFGGMENTGNTTIVTDAALITEHTLDMSLLYAHSVIVHEFEHNQCGSETTMETPFDIWLNEAYTVDVERQFIGDLFDQSFIRLHQVDAIRNPLLGPLAIEDAGHFGRIVRDGFNEPDELIDAVTYVKAAEVIRMLRLLLGRESFRAGKSLYFSRFHFNNANTDQFFQCFEEVAGISLEQFKTEWLYRIGYPRVTASTQYDNETGAYRIRFRQELDPGQRPFFLPIDLALVNARGCDIQGTNRVFILRDAEAELSFDHLPEKPVFASINRDYSFYGACRPSKVDPEILSLQVRLDPNTYNRVDAMRQLTDMERIKLIENPDLQIAEQWLSLYGELLSDERLTPSQKAYLLRIDEQPLDRTYATWYRELVAAKEKLMLSINARYREKLVEEFRKLDTYSLTRGKSTIDGIQERLLKGVLLDLIAIDDTPESHLLIINHFYTAIAATDRVSALTALNRSSASSRRIMLEEVYEKWHAHLSGYANYLRVVGSGTLQDVFEMVAHEKNRATFDITQPTWCRALFLTLAANNKVVWTDRGIRWVADTVIELAPLNTTTAGRLLNAFQHARKLRPALREQVLAALQYILRNVTEEASPAIYRQAFAYLGGTSEAS